MVYVCIVTKIMESIFLAMTIVLMVETLLHANALLPALVYFFLSTLANSWASKTLTKMAGKYWLFQGCLGLKQNTSKVLETFSTVVNSICRVISRRDHRVDFQAIGSLAL